MFGAAAVGGYQWYSSPSTSQFAACANPTAFNHQKVTQDIVALLDKGNNISMAPTLVRLAWHNSGVFSKTGASGNANSAGMRFEPECKHGANAGLKVARDFLEPVKKANPNISYADLWTLAGTVAIAYLNGSVATWRWGRKDAQSGAECNQDPSRLPDAMQGADHIRDVFSRMGFTDREAVALIGAHCIGECHANASGFVGPWTHSKLMFSNEFFVALLNEKWVVDKSKPQKQFTDTATKQLMMLPADMAVREDPKLRKIAEEYAANNDLFLRDFAAAWTKLQELNYKPGQLQDCDKVKVEQ